MARLLMPWIRAGGVALGLVVPVLAQASPAPTSSYTKFDLKPPACRADPGPGEGFTCAGIGGWQVLVGFPAVGASVTVARSRRSEPHELTARDGRALVVDGPSASGSIEWRGAMRAGRLEPSSATLRVEVLDAAQRRETIDTGRAPARPRRTQALIVYRLGPAGACQIAYVDARANANANDLARAAADEATNCPVDRVAVLGRSSPILADNIR